MTSSEYPPNAISSESKAKIPTLITPQQPQTPWTLKASKGSSIFSFWSNLDDPQQSSPPQHPTGMAAPGAMTAQGAVTLTNPAKMPLRMAGTHHILPTYFS